MAAGRSMYHQSMKPILDSCHLSQVGENVAFGYPSGKAVVNAWMHSPDHKKNLLNARPSTDRAGRLSGHEQATGTSRQVLGRKL